jgi:hypothetical protein
MGSDEDILTSGVSLDSLDMKLAAWADEIADLVRRANASQHEGLRLMARRMSAREDALRTRLSHLRSAPWDEVEQAKPDLKKDFKAIQS